MNANQKTQVSNELSRLSQATSQAHMAKLLEVSTAVVSQVVNNNWKLISDEMWNNLKVRLRIDPNWNTVQINNTKGIIELLTQAQKLSISIAISDKAGKSKTESFSHYWRENIKDVIYVECKNYWTKKSYIRQLLISAGLDSIGTTEELINRLLKHVKGMPNPLIIIDQFDKLKDPQMDLFMDFYNDLDGHCGFMLSGVEHFENRIKKGVNKNKIGYAELYSRIGRNFIKLNSISYNDVELICFANGVRDADEVIFIYENSEGDLRRVRRDIDKYKLKQQKSLKKTA